MTRDKLTPTRLLGTVGLIRTACTGAEATPFFCGAKMIALTAKNGAFKEAGVKHIRNVTNNLRFYNQIAVKVSLYHSVADYRTASGFKGHVSDVRDFAVHMIDGALQREIDRETAIMARGENVAANQRRRRVLGKYLSSKPYRVIKNFYGVNMQNLAASAPAETGSGNNAFHSDIIHERTDKIIYTTTQAQIERASPPPAHRTVISDGDLNRIATQAARQVERKMRSERERNGKW